jgi:hypothetical protein
LVNVGHAGAIIDPGNWNFAALTEFLTENFCARAANEKLEQGVPGKGMRPTSQE